MKAIPQTSAPTVTARGSRPPGSPRRKWIRRSSSESPRKSAVDGHESASSRAADDGVVVRRRKTVEGRGCSDQAVRHRLSLDLTNCEASRYQCPECHKGFTLAESLRIHSLIHGDADPAATIASPPRRRVSAPAPTSTPLRLGLPPSPRRSWDLTEDNRKTTIQVLQHTPISRASPEALTRAPRYPPRTAQSAMSATSAKTVARAASSSRKPLVSNDNTPKTATFPKGKRSDIRSKEGAPMRMSPAQRDGGSSQCSRPTAQHASIHSGRVAQVPSTVATTSSNKPAHGKRRLPTPPAFSAVATKTRPLVRESRALPMPPSRRPSREDPLMETTRGRRLSTLDKAAVDSPNSTWPARAPADTLSKQEAAAQRMRDDFRAWLEWREVDAVRAQAVANAATVPTAWANPNNFVIGPDGAPMRRPQDVTEVDRLAERGVVWMHMPSSAK
mmetsp:Transcript_8448/g.21600  ORF Transcript_8448/g.21600 Transcript_8448/m.21600 type:complete len:445 (+) Transcript_8448:178-1512(+)